MDNNEFSAENQKNLYQNGEEPEAAAAKEIPPVNTSIEGEPMPESDQPQSPLENLEINPEMQAEPEQPQDLTSNSEIPPAGQDEYSQNTNNAPPPQGSDIYPNVAPQPETIVCPRCHNLIPYENFCPVCSLSLRGAPPAQPMRAVPYAVPPVIYSTQQGRYPANPYNSPYPQQRSAPPVMPQPPFTGYSGAGFVPPPPITPPPAYGMYPPQNFPQQQHTKMQTGTKWLIGVGIALAVLFFIAIVGVITFGILTVERGDSQYQGSNPFSQFFGGQKENGFGNYSDFIPPFGEDKDAYSDSLPLPEDVLPQYFIGDTVIKNDITYEFDYCRTEEKYNQLFVVVGLTVTNNSGESFTLTPDLFILENSMGGNYKYYTDPDTFHSPLERKVLMPGEKITKNLTYAIDKGDYDYLPLFVLDSNGAEMFFVYLQIYK